MQVRRLLPMIGLFAGFVPVLAFAQTSLEEGKSPSQIFASDCAVCHKSPKGLAKGYAGVGGIAGFLRQHYTTGREQAAALASYILGAGGNEGAKPQERGRKPAAERTAKPVEEPKPTRQSRRPTRGEETPPPGPAAKLHEPAPEEAAKPEAKPENEPIAVEEPIRPGRKPPARGRKPAAEQPEPPRGSSAARGRRTVPELENREPPSEPARAEPSPAPGDVPAMTGASPAAAPAGDVTPVPRDDIPD